MNHTWIGKKGKIDVTQKYRNEWKYCCTVNDLSIISGRLESVLELDSHSNPDGKYSVHSLYFDDYRDSAVKANDAGISERMKYRIRYYGDRFDFLRLERKEKRDGRCHKESCVILPDEFQKIMEGNAQEILWQTENDLLKQFCIRCMSGYLRPRAVIDFERVAYVEKITNIRITLDKNISVSDNVSHFADGDYIRYPIQEKGQHVLEVKFDYILPGYIKHIVTGRNLIQTSFSKYSLGRKTLQKMGR